MSNQLADFSSPAQLTLHGAGAKGSSDSKYAHNSPEACSISEIKRLGLSRRKMLTPSAFKRLTKATRSAFELILSGSPKCPSRHADSLRSSVSSRCAATSFTFHFRASVCFSQSPDDKEESS